MGRMACRSRADLFGTDLPNNPPWDPVPPASIPQGVPADSRLDGANQETSPATIQARQLQASASRLIWGNLLDFGDWTSFLYLPFLVSLFLVVLYFMIRAIANLAGHQVP